MKVPIWGDKEIDLVAEKLVALVATEDLPMWKCFEDAQWLAGLPADQRFDKVPSEYVKRLIPQARIGCEMRSARQLQELENLARIT